MEKESVLMQILIYQKDFIFCTVDTIRIDVEKNVNVAGGFSVLVDETKIVSRREQLTVIKIF